MRMRFLMKKLLLACTALAAVAIAAPANAALQVLDGGTFSAATCTPDCTGTFAPPAAESSFFTDIYTFQVVGGPAVLNDDSATNALTLPGQTIASWTLNVFINATGNNATFSNGGIVTGSASIVSMVGSDQIVALVNKITLQPGFYGVVTNGIVGGTATTYSGSFSFSPTSAVPEPATWAMMLLGFAGLGLAFRQSRRKVAIA
jgi:hypothetical protein